MSPEESPPEDSGRPEEANGGAAPTGTVQDIDIQTEMEQSFLDYAMSVITARALPDVRDGLKPVHRRILWGMYDQGNRPNRPHVKCARVVGDVMGKYHPHGDQAIYDALVRLGQRFSLRHPLIDPHGNFGSPNDPPAAMRYTECRLDELAMRLLDGIDEQTVDFTDNFDATEQEPLVLPSRFPNLLVNGSQGIAVGMATNIPPHNLGEVVDAVNHLLENPDADNEALMQFVKGPDFPTRGCIMGHQGIRDAYTTGQGAIKVRAAAEIVEDGANTRIVVTEIPYQTSAEIIEEKVADLVNRRAVDGIRQIHNESAKGRTKLVFDLKRDAPALVVLNNLYKHSPLQTNFTVNMVALVDGVPRTMTLRECLVAYVRHQEEVVRRRTEFRLEEARRREHILEGLVRAVDMIDEIIAAIRSSENRAAARATLTGEQFAFSEIQANHILDMPLGRLTQLGRQELNEELAQKRALISELEAILADEATLRSVVREELNEVRTGHATERRTRILADEGEIDIEALIDDEDLMFSLSAAGYVKTVVPDEFKTQSRGGKGVIGANLKDGDYISTLIHTTAHAYLMFFTSRGRVFRIKAHEVPRTSRTARGMAIVNLLQLAPDETVSAVIDTRDYETMRYLLFVTRGGMVKRTRFLEYDKTRSAGLIAINLREGDELVRVLPTSGTDDVCLVSASGRLMRFSESEVRSMGRSAAGVRGMRLVGEDGVVAASAVHPGDEMLVATDQGFGKRLDLDHFVAKHRGGQGNIAMKLSDERGAVVAARVVAATDEVFAVASNGVTIRMPVASVSQQGPYAAGVRIMTVPDDQTMVAIAPVFVGDQRDDQTE
ncbi:DNA gyrase subunit A [Candidatus Poriferisocius sp.]|uniref:DNA gyrase subunit A n=1 Tax=Candidatus Poriferisocius sp. TaxID=3101276 RepID=UPI003B5AE2B5